MRNEKGQFVQGYADRRLPIGTVRIRTRHKRDGEQRAFIKVAEPNVWVLRARHVWEQHFGPIPEDMGIHHKDEDKLNDAIENLELVSKAQHLEIHRPEYAEKTIAALVAARKERRWSTRSASKKTGHPASWTDEQLIQAVTAYREGEGSLREIGKQYDIPYNTLARKVKAT